MDKISSAELCEAMNSMLKWCGFAEVCYFYMGNVEAFSYSSSWHLDSDFRTSKWFTREWTLQRC
jgi:hypothetical protein